jgi:MerR HTH family regulatory protein
VSARPRLHGSFLAGEVGELAGASGNTIGQWARRGLIRSSQSDGEPRVYSVEDIAEATVVAELIGRGVRHLDVHRASERLAPRYGRWPLSDAPLGTIVEDGGRPRIVLREREGIYELVSRGWQLMGAPPPVDEVRVRLRHVT